MGEGKDVKWKDLQDKLTVKAGEPADFTVEREPVPIIFVPGIMGSRLRQAGGKKKVWDPDDQLFMLWNYLMASPADRKKALVGDKFSASYLEAYGYKVPDSDHAKSYFKNFPGAEQAQDRGWAGVMWGVYGDVLKRMAEGACWLPTVTACFDLPVYAFGFNWTDDVVNSGKQLKQYIDHVIDQHSGAKHVILVSHSMGGLVTRSACKLHGAESKVLGVVHGVQPATGAPVAYWQMKGGIQRAPPGTPIFKSIMSSLMARVLGSSGKEVTALLGNIPGGLSLLPNKQFNDGKAWLKFLDREGKEQTKESLPQKGNPFDEIYRKKGVYWALIDPALLDPGAKKKSKSDDPMAADTTDDSTPWDGFEAVLKLAEKFHDKLKAQQHAETHNMWGIGKDYPTSDVVEYKSAPHGWREVAGDIAQVALGTYEAGLIGGILTGGAGAIVAGGAALGGQLLQRSDYWQAQGGFKTKLTTPKGVTFEVTLQPPTGEGDGTVPVCSGSAMKQQGDSQDMKIPDKPAKGQDYGAFAGTSHQDAYKGDSPTQDFALDAINKLCLLKIKKSK